MQILIKVYSLTKLGVILQKLVHKKYTYKDGKKYGPYLYENKRVGEQVFTKYVGKESSNNHLNKKQLIAYLLIFLGAFLFILSMDIPSSSPTGKVSLEVDTVKYDVGEPISGVVKFNLKKGEFIPSDSAVKVRLDGQEREYILSDLVSENKKNGEFYAENSNLFGMGEGYGEMGEKVTTPEIEFELSIVDSLGEEKIIPGKVSKGNDFVYSGEYVSYSLVEGSVKVDGKEAEFSAVSSEDSSEEIRITTNYEVIEEGYGEDYLNDYSVSINIEVDDFNLTAVNDVLNVELSHNGELIASAQKEIIVQGEESESDNISENIEINNEVDVSEVEEASSILILKNFTNIKIPNGRTVTLNLNDYFSGASSYSIEVSEDIVANIDSGVLSLSASEGFKGTREARVKAISLDDEIESNLFEIIVASGSINIATSRSEIKLGENVKWTKNVTLENPEEISIEIPLEAENIEVKSVDNGEEKEVDATVSSFTGNVVIEIDLKTEEEKPQRSGISRFFKNIFDSITGNVVSEVNVNDVVPGEEEVKEVLINDPLATEYVIEYETPAPTAEEFETNLGKTVIISAPDNLGYTDVLSFTSIPEVYSTGQENMIKIYWVEDGSYVAFDAYDLDTNGKIDYVEWITPHLSNQTFEIILITNAIHLDSNKAFLEDVYNIVSVQDGNYVTIPANDYVRVTFEKNLSSTKDITLYARSSGAQVEVYEKDGTEILMTFDISSEGEYKKYLTNLIGEQDSFDLKVIGASVEFDLIIDPSTPGNINSCQVLDVSGTYTLTQDIIDISGTCFDIQANNIVLNGNGHKIAGDWSNGGSDFGIYSNASNVNISDFGNITGFDYGIKFMDNYNSRISNVNVTFNTYGIYFENSSNDTLTNIDASLSGHGVFLYMNSSYNNLSRIITNNGGNGVNIVFGSNNNYLSNIIANYNSGYGIFIDECLDNTINGAISNGDAYGVYLYHEANRNLLNNISASSNTYGVYLYLSSNNRLFNVNTSNNLEQGILLGTSMNNTLINITSNSNSIEGVYFYVSSNNSLTNAEVNSNGDAGLYIYAGSNNNQFLNVSAISNSYDGVLFTDSSNNRIYGLNSSLNGNRGIFMSANSNNTFSNITLFSNGLYGVFLQASENNTFTNLDSYDNLEQEILSYDWEYGSIGNNLTYDNEHGKVEFDPLGDDVVCNLNLEAGEGISISSTKIQVDSDNCPALNVSSLVTFKNYPTDIPYDSFIALGGKSCDDCINYTSVNSSYVVVRVPHWTTIQKGFILACGQIYSPNSAYDEVYLELKSNLIDKSNPTCLEILRDNVTINGLGRRMDGIDSSNSRGIHISGKNNVLKNIVISDFDYGAYINLSSNLTVTNATFISNGIAGIELISSSNNTLLNISANSSFYGISLSTNSNNNVLSNITVTRNTHGIIIYSNSNNSLFNINSSSNSNNGIYLYTTSNNLLSDVVTSFNNYGVYLYSNSNNNTLANITSSLNSLGIFFQTNSNNNLLYDSIVNSNTNGIYSTTSSNNILSNITANSNTGTGINFASGSNNISLSNITANSNVIGLSIVSNSNNSLSDISTRSNSQYGVSLEYTSQNIIKDSNSSLNGNGFFIYESSNNVLSNITANSNTNQGVYLFTGSNNALSNITVSYNNYGLYFNNNANGNIVDNVFAEDNSAYGVSIYSSSNNTLSNITANSNYFGVFFSNSFNNAFYSTNSSSNDIGVVLSSSSNNSFINLNSYSNSDNEIAGSPSFGTSPGNVLIYNNSYGKIEFVPLSQDIAGNIIFSDSSENGNISISNNSVYVNSNDVPGINVSANITLYGVVNNFQNPSVYKDTSVCNDCANFTSLNAGNMIRFNVSNFGRYYINHTPLGIAPTSNNYDPVYGGTDFNQVIIYTNVNNLSLANSYGKIKFPENYGVNVSGEDYDSNVIIGEGFVSVNSSALHQSFNSSTNITMAGVTCPAVPYYSIDFGNSSFNLRQGAIECTELTDPSCTHIACNEQDNTLSFVASHFSSYVEQFSCGELNQDDTIYSLQVNITNYDGTCFNITANNVTIEGNGNNIYGTNNDSVEYWAINSEGNSNITVRNLNIYNFGDWACTGPCDGGGIRLYNVNDSYIESVNIYDSQNGINLENSYNNDLSSIITSGSVGGIVLNNSAYNSFLGESSSNIDDLYCSSSDTNYNYGLTYSSQTGCDSWINTFYINSCQAISQAGAKYVLRNDILNYSGTCFNITANNVTLDLNWHNVSGNSDELFNGYGGVMVDNHNLTIIKNGNISSFMYGVRSYNSFNISIINITTFGNNQGIVIEDLGFGGPYLFGNYIINPSLQDEISVSNPSGTNYLIYQNQFGNFSKTFDVLSLASLAYPSTGMGGVNISNNSILMPTSGEVTLFGNLSLGKQIPTIKSGNAICDDCVNYTSLTNENVRFSIPGNGFFSYNIGDAAEIYECGQTLDTPGITYSLMEDIADYDSSNCFDITASDIILEGNGKYITGYGWSSGSIFFGINASNVENITIRNLTIGTFGDYNLISFPSDGGAIAFENVSNSLVRNVDIHYNYYGLRLINSSGNSFKEFDSEGNVVYGIYSMYSDNNLFNNTNLSANQGAGSYLEYSDNNAFYNTYSSGDLQFLGSSSNIVNNLTSEGASSGVILRYSYSGDVYSNNNILRDINILTPGYAGLILADGTNNTIINVSINNSGQYGVDLQNSEITSFEYDLINVYSNSAAFIDLHTTSNNLDNVTITDSVFGSYDIGANTGELSFARSNYGNIQFLESINGSGSNLVGNSSSDIIIGNNSVYIGASNSGLNRSANITIYGLATNFIIPIITKDGSECTDCYALTDLNEGNVVFNVTGAGNYSVEESFTGELTDCATISISGVTYTLQNDIVDHSGTCFDIQTSNIVLDGNGYSIDGDGSGNGIYSVGGNVTVKNFKNISEFDTGITSDATTFNNITISSSSQYGISMAFKNNNIFMNINLVSNNKGIYHYQANNNTYYNITSLDSDVQDLSVVDAVWSSNSFIDSNINVYSYASGHNNYFANSRYGQILFQGSSGTGVNLIGNSNSIISFANRSVNINSSVAGFNGSANVTLYNLPTNFVNATIYKNGEVCTNCYNFTSLNAGNVRFNITQTGNYSISEYVSPYDLTECRNLTSTGETYNLQNNIAGINGDCFVIQANNITINGNGYSITSEVSSLPNNKGINARNVNGLAVKNLYISRFSNGIYMENVSNSNISDNTIEDSKDQGFNLIDSYNNNLIKNTLDENEEYQIRLSGNTYNNYLINNSLTNRVGSYSILDLTSNSNNNYLVYRNNLGEIAWTSQAFTRNITTYENIVLGDSIIIESNNIGVDADHFANSNNRIDNSGANITLYSVPSYSSYNSKFKASLFGVRKDDNLRCRECYNFTNLLAGGLTITARFNVSEIGHNYSVELAPRSKQQISLGKGWNLFGLITDDNYTENANVTITLQPGSNYIAYSGANNISKDNVTVTLSDGTELNWGQTVQLFKAYNLFGYYETQENRKRFKYAGLDDDQLRVGKGYIVEVNDDEDTGGIAAGDYVNITFVGSGGSLTSDTYAWSDLMFMNESNGEVKNITEASTGSNPWISSTLFVWNQSIDEGAGDYMEIQSDYSPILNRRNYVSAWEGAQINSFTEDIALLRQD